MTNQFRKYFLTFFMLLYVFIEPASGGKFKPVVLWHGMGDCCCNPLSLGKIKKVIEEQLPEVYINSLKIGSNILEVKDACKQIKADPNLAGGYNAIGFSQGAQFLRAVAQRCPEPQMNNLISIGGQHQGVYGLPNCAYPKHKWCDYLRNLLNYGAYRSWVQDQLVQAEYWHDPINEDDYIKGSVFLSDINNEGQINQEYIDNLKKLANLVLVMFENDTMVEPKESEWFGFYTPGQATNITRLQDSKLYLDDKLGLKAMDEKGRIKFLSLPGDHLQFSEEWFQETIINQYLK